MARKEELDLYDEITKAGLVIERFIAVEAFD